MKKSLLPILVVGILGCIAFWLVVKDRSTTLSVKPTDFIPQHPSMIQGFELSDSLGVLRIKNTKYRWMLEDSLAIKPGLAERWGWLACSFQVIAPVPDSHREKWNDSIKKNGINVSISTTNKKKFEYALLLTDNLKDEAIILIKNSLVRIRIPALDPKDKILFSTRREAWTELTLMTLDPKEIKEITLEYTENPQSSFRFFISQNQWHLQKLSPGSVAEPASNVAASDWLQNFQWIPALRELNDKEKEGVWELAEQVPYRMIRISLADQGVRTLYLFRKKALLAEKSENQFDPEEVFVFLAEPKRMFVVKYSVFDNILIDYEYLRP